jgi:hypothetical protein
METSSKQVVEGSIRYCWLISCSYNLVQSGGRATDIIGQGKLTPPIVA